MNKNELIEQYRSSQSYANLKKITADQSEQGQPEPPTGIEKNSCNQRNTSPSRAGKAVCYIP